MLWDEFRLYIIEPNLKWTKSTILSLHTLKYFPTLISYLQWLYIDWIGSFGIQQLKYLQIKNLYLCKKSYSEWI